MLILCGEEILCRKFLTCIFFSLLQTVVNCCSNLSSDNNSRYFPKVLVYSDLSLLRQSSESR